MKKGKYRRTDKTTIGKQRGNFYRKMKRSHDEGYTQTEGSLNETFRPSQMSFSIRRE